MHLVYPRTSAFADECGALKTHGRLSPHHRASSSISVYFDASQRVQGPTATPPMRTTRSDPRLQPPSFTFVGACAPGHQAGCGVTLIWDEGQDIRTDFDDRVVVVRHGADCRRIERSCARLARQ